MAKIPIGEIPRFPKQVYGQTTGQTASTPLNRSSHMSQAQLHIRGLKSGVFPRLHLLITAYRYKRLFPPSLLQQSSTAFAEPPRVKSRWKSHCTGIPPYIPSSTMVAYLYLKNKRKIISKSHMSHDSPKPSEVKSRLQMLQKRQKQKQCPRISFPFRATDTSDSIKWPHPVDRVVSDGKVKYFEQILPHTPPSETKAAKRWLMRIGTYLAREVMQLDGSGRKVYYLTDLPEGYRLYIHKSGESTSPREDCYLYGSKTVAHFRLPAEFFLHAK
jgi:hypothetical protein